MEGDRINFYAIDEPYGCFTNWSDHSLNYKGYNWQTSEHAFHAMKFEGTEHVDTVANAAGPAEAAELGRNRSLPLRKDWEEVKDRIMEEIVTAKFSQNAELKELLLSTGDKLIVEHTVNDSYWGDAGDGSGKNMLGQILMKVRGELAGS